MINVCNFISDYITDFPLRKNIKAEKSKNPKLDMLALYYLSCGRLHFLRARDNRVYWYCIVNPTYLDAADYILRANGMVPSRHLSYMFYPCAQVLRVPAKEIHKSKENIDFVNQTMVLTEENIDYNLVYNYVQDVQKQLNQNVK